MSEFSELVEQMRVNDIKHEIVEATKDYEDLGEPKHLLRRVAKNRNMKYNEIQKLYYELLEGE